MWVTVWQVVAALATPAPRVSATGRAATPAAAAKILLRFIPEHYVTRRGMSRIFPGQNHNPPNHRPPEVNSSQTDSSLKPEDVSEEHTSELQSLRHLVCRLL